MLLPAAALARDRAQQARHYRQRVTRLRPGHGPHRQRLGCRMPSTSSGLLATNLPLFPGRLQLPVALRVDLLLPPRQHFLRGDVARGADVLHLRYFEQTACFTVLLKWPIGGASSILTKSGNPLKTVDATHPPWKLSST